MNFFSIEFLTVIGNHFIYKLAVKLNYIVQFNILKKIRHI